ncbi:MAG: serine/threonine protein kinase [Bryobacterales bacterium]|nr:serine/threonine protein kinase [Bryobacterales bacterium]
MRYKVGDRIGDYLITGHLGSGASGDVFRVEHAITNRVEALKVLYATESRERAERILREAKLQARLNHPNIVAVHNAFWANGDLALVMELVEGQSLKQAMAQGPVAAETVLHYARQILRALAHAHRRGVIHRDVSPANILIAGKGQVKLTDFGLAKERAGPNITQAGVLMGSVFYTSPEQVRSSAEVDFRTDIYSCGAVLYELYTGAKPFDGGNVFELMLAQAESAAVAPSQRNAAVPARLDAVLLKALEKEPQARYGSALEFLNALEGAAKPKWMAAAYAAAAFVAVSAIVGGMTLSSRPQAEAAPVPPVPMPRVAIEEPPFPRPPLSIPAVPDEPAVMPAPAAPVAGPAVRKAAPAAVAAAAKPARTFVLTPDAGLDNAAPPPLPAAPVIAGAPQAAPPEAVAGEPAVPPQPRGFLRGVVRRMNIFRKD